MKRLAAAALYASLLLTLCGLPRGADKQAAARGEQAPALTPKFPLPQSGLRLERPTRAGAFLDVLGRKSAVFGYEHRALEAWAYPLQLLDQFELSFRLEGYPAELRGADTQTRIEVRPEATTIVYSHAAFTVRQTIYAPLEEPGVIMLLDIDSTLPLVVDASFRPRLKLMWPAGMMTGSLGWDAQERAYFITEESKRYAAVVGSPAARDLPQTPSQEEPRDLPAHLQLEASREDLRRSFLPIVIAGSVRGRDDARATYERLLGNARTLYEGNVRHYRRLLEETTTISTPDERLDEAFAWAKVGIDKGLVENSLLGTGLVAGFRTAGESERPGFAWFFGRDALWTALAADSACDFALVRASLEFLAKYQRADGKIPHEISQSASLVPWFTDYPYPWASADATPLYLIAHADYLRASGDLSFTRANWDSILRAARFTAATDTDANGLVENTKYGHGWVEGGALYPPHEEIYMQGLWVAALRGLSEMAEALDDAKTAAEARAGAERTRLFVEQTYWLPARGFYAFATNLPRTEHRTAEPGPNRAARQARMDELDAARIVDEDTVMPAVPLWFQTLEETRAQQELDHLGSGHMATDWGTRIISEESRLYDPLSYHNGSVWPLFTGWASVGAYRYGRPHVGFQALAANAGLARQNALGYVTELLSGEFNAPFGRSSHHQVWSEAMVVSPLVRGLFGLEALRAGGAVRFAPQLPADWDAARIDNFTLGASRLSFSVTRAAGSTTINITRRAPTESNDARRATEQARAPVSVSLAPAFPLDARIKRVTLNGRPVRFNVTRAGDVQRAEVSADISEEAEVAFLYEEGTDVYLEPTDPPRGARNESLRVLRSHAEKNGLRLLLEGLPGVLYSLRIRTPHALKETDDTPFQVEHRAGARDPALLVRFEGAPGQYVRRELFVGFR